jgi:hypothetical protein
MQCRKALVAQPAHSNPRAQPAYHQGGAARYEPGAASTIRKSGAALQAHIISVIHPLRCGAERFNRARNELPQLRNSVAN